MHERTIANVHRQQLVEVQGQTDVLVMGVPYLGPYNVNSVMNPILATCMGLGYFFNSYRGQPVVRRGGAVILYHPVTPEFSQLHHPSYVDFFEEVLAESTDPAVIEAKFEQQYATDPWYIHLYRTSYAYHGVHPFYMWYWAAHAMDHVGDVIWVGAEPQDRQRMGFRAASTLEDALEMASGTVGRSPSITYLHNPPHLIADVRWHELRSKDGVDDVRTRRARLALGPAAAGAAVGRAVRAAGEDHGLPHRLGAARRRRRAARGRPEGRARPAAALPGAPARRGARRARRGSTGR